MFVRTLLGYSFAAVLIENGFVKWLVADWDGNKAHVFKSVVEGLVALGHTTETFSRSGMGRRKELIGAIRSGAFDALLTWQRFYPMQRDILSAIADTAIPTVFMDFGFMPHYGTVVFDSAGENAASSWPKLWKSGGPIDLSSNDIESAEALIQSESARGNTLSRPTIAGLESITTPFVFVPLQRPGDSVIQYDSIVHEFGHFFRRVLDLAHGTCFVVAKTHPLDLGLYLGMPDQADGSHLIIRQAFDGDNEAICDYLLSRASLVVGVNSNMLFRAMLFGTPLIATGRGWYSGSGAVHEVQGVGGLTSLSIPPPDLDAQRRYVAMCLTRQLLFEDLNNPGKLSQVLRRIGVISERETAAP